MIQVCKCGVVKDAHFDPELMMGKKILPGLEDAIRVELVKLYTIWGEVAFHAFERDNLIYLEKLVADKEHDTKVTKRIDF